MATEKGKLDEMTRFAIAFLYTEYLEDTSKITPQKIAERVKKDNNRIDVTVLSTTFTTNIEFKKEGNSIKHKSNSNRNEFSATTKRSKNKKNYINTKVKPRK